MLFKHGLRAALTPLVTMAGLDFATLLGGAIITEYGVRLSGPRPADRAGQHEPSTYRRIIGVVVLAGSFVILANIVVDISYAFIDPRVRLG